MQALILSLHTPSIPDGVKGQKHFSENSHVAYQIKGNGTEGSSLTGVTVLWSLSKTHLS